MEKLVNELSFRKLKTINWIILIFSSSLFFFSIPTYDIFPEIPSDSPQIKRNLEENTTIENCISAISSIDFIDYINKEINKSEYNLLGIYQPYHKYEHKRTLKNGTDEYKYNNNSYEEGYNTKEIKNRYLKTYYYNNKIIKTKKTNYIVNKHYNKSTHSCINGYKSCGKVAGKNFRLFCVPEKDECPIKTLINYPEEKCHNFSSSQNYITKVFHNRNYFHYIRYNENDTINILYLDIGVYLPYLNGNFFKLNLFDIKVNDYFQYSTYDFFQFKSQNDITEAYPNYNKVNIYLASKYVNLTEYNDMKCFSDGYSDVPIPNIPITNNSDTNKSNSDYVNNPNLGNSNNGIGFYGNDVKNVQFSYNDENIVNFRNKMKNEFEIGLILSILFNFICIILIVFEIFLFNKLDFEDTITIFYIFHLLRLFHFIFNLIIFIYELFLLRKYKFNVRNTLFISYSKLTHGIFLTLCLIILLLDILGFYFLFNLLKVFKELKSKYQEIKNEQTITQNENISVENNNKGLQINKKDSNDLIIPKPAESDNVPITIIKVQHQEKK